ncbi:MAG: hypothetical protein JWO67_4512 [Streptosporangiaceae bacterium]|nr:hypothetical protein [Streptosporangiaceae bacterium]
MKPEDIQHGSYAGWNQCRKNPEGACGPCRKASAEYMAQWRKDRPRAYSRERGRSSARSRAAWRLARMQPTLFRALVQEELQKAEAS